MIIHLIGAGPRTDIFKKLDRTNSDNILIGVDNGANYLLKEGIIPNAIFGDFDSLNAEDLTKLKKTVPKVFIYPPEKDETDLELAVDWALSQNPEKIYLHCVTGKRLDHEFGSLSILIKNVNVSVPIYIVDDYNEIYVLNEGTHQISKQSHYKYVSFFSIGLEIENLTLRGFKYPLTNHKLLLGSSLCVSNELLDEVGSISFSRGIALVVRSKD